MIVDNDITLRGPSVSQLNALVEQIDGIVVTNPFGHVCELAVYEQWCKDNNKLLLLDNAATSVAFTSDGRCIHDVGDGAMV